MTTKIHADTGIEFPDSTVQGSAGISQVAADARYVNVAGSTITGNLTLRTAGRPLDISSSTDLDNWSRYLRSDGVSALGNIGGGGGAASGDGGPFDFCVIAAANKLILGGVSTVSISAPFLIPQTDANTGLGIASNRWQNLFVVNAPTVGSDARTKTAIRPFTDNELAASKVLAKEMGFYKWLDGGVRDHCGLTVQRVIEVMEANNLVAFDYAFICYDAEPDRYSLRQEEMHNFILRGMEARLAALEERL